MRLPKTLSSKLLTPEVQSLVGQSLQLARNYPLKRTPIELEKLIRTNPAVAAASEIRTVLLPLLMLGEYTHDDPAIQAEVRRELVALQGSWRGAIAKMGSYQNYGFSYTEVEYRITLAGCGLSRVRTLNQQYTNFQGMQGDIINVIYATPQAMQFSPNGWVTIPYPSGIHLVNQAYFTLGYDPKGIALLDRVAPYVDAFNLMMAALSLAANRQATPFLYGKTNTSAQQMIFGDDGRPVLDPATGQPTLVNAGEKLKQDLEQVENGSIAVIDLQDELGSIAQSQRGTLIQDAIQIILQLIMMCFLVPQTVIGMSATGVGDSGLSESHQRMLLMAVESDLGVISEGLIESLLKNMLIWNHGPLESYGYFPITSPRDSTAVQALLAIIPGLVASTVLDPKDADLIASVKEDLGI